MKLQNFYKIIAQKSVGEDKISVTLLLDESHEVYKGHFPNHPVLPGVAMLQIIKELSENHFSTSLLMQTANRVKFLQIVNPFENNKLVFELIFQQEENTLKVKNSTTFVDGATVMQCSLAYKKLR